MKKLGLFFLILSLGLKIQAQELAAEVVVDYSMIQASNTSVYQTLQRSLRDFINNTKWTEDNYKQEERIECTFSIILQEKVGNDDYKGSITVQSRRPVYNSNYFTPVINLQDNDFQFKYTEFETLVFNPRRFSGRNLTDVIAYYIYLIIGTDADTFSLNGGTPYFTLADKIVDMSVNKGYTGWNSFDGMRSRENLIGDILKPLNNTLRSIVYNYHINGLDKFYNQELYAKNNIANNLIKLKNYQNNVLFYPMELFISAKKDEIVSIFSGGTPSTANINDLKQNLTLIAPKYTDDYWAKLKN